jgi:hypothetical protein
MKLNVLFFILLAFSLSCTIFISWVHHRLSAASSPNIFGQPEAIRRDYRDTVILDNFPQVDPEIVTNPEVHLSCSEFGGPDDEAAQQMVYWSDIPADAKFQSPFKKSDRVQYLTFEPDGGGWNNIRLVMDNFLILFFQEYS